MSHSGSTEALFIYNGKGFRKWCKGESLPKKQFLFIPLNVSNTQWTLPFINLKTKILYILDPLTQHANAGVASKTSSQISFLRKKFGYSKGLTTGSIQKVFQKGLYTRK